MRGSRMGMLGVLLAHALIPAGLVEAIERSRERSVSPLPGRTKSRRGRLKKKRKPLFCRAAYGRPVKYLQAAPTINGIRHRWEKGQLVPRVPGARGARS